MTRQEQIEQLETEIHWMEQDQDDLSTYLWEGGFPYQYNSLEEAEAAYDALVADINAKKSDLEKLR